MTKKDKKVKKNHIYFLKMLFFFQMGRKSNKKKHIQFYI